MATNRDLYLAINDLVADPAIASDRSLEDFLRAMLPACRAYRDSSALTFDQFIGVLRQSFVDPPAPYDPDWGDSQIVAEPRGFAWFESVLLGQIVDLHEMREAGILDGKWIELGVNAPRGGRWYNFDPRQYLGCAAAGAIGGWEPGDPGGRDFVPGAVAVQDSAGNIISADPRELERPIRPVQTISWEQCTEFLHCGQTYE